MSALVARGCYRRRGPIDKGWRRDYGFATKVARIGQLTL